MQGFKAVGGRKSGHAPHGISGSNARRLTTLFLLQRLATTLINTGRGLPTGPV